MSLVTIAALGIGLLVALPILAHMLRRRPPKQIAFAATELVPPHSAVNARRAAFDDRPLLLLRILSVVALAILGATPFVSCSQLNLGRVGGASLAIAIVIDDSMSMRAAAPSGEGSRLDVAKTTALELLGRLEPGDMVMVVAAGEPPRILAAPSAQTADAKQAIEALAASDRSTALDAAVNMADGMLGRLRQPDKRIALLSDLADGSEKPLPTLTAGGYWMPVELSKADTDCAVASARLRSGRVAIKVACSPAVAGKTETKTRRLVLRSGNVEHAEMTSAWRPGVQEVSLSVDGKLTDAARRSLSVTLEGDDAVVSNNVAMVAESATRLKIGVIHDREQGRVATGGAPPLEQALKALRGGVSVVPLASMPEDATALGPMAALIIDDVAGFNPAQRRLLRQWMSGGGSAWLTLGPRAAGASLGTSFEPLIPGVVRYGKTDTPGLSVTGDGVLAGALGGLDDFAPKRRAEVDVPAKEKVSVGLRFADERPFLWQRDVGLGVAWTTAVPFTLEESDLVLRPGFLALLERFLVEAARRSGGGEAKVGAPWRTRPSVVTMRRLHPSLSPVDARVEGGIFQPPVAGIYVALDESGKVQGPRRSAEIETAEVDLTPRPMPDTSRSIVSSDGAGNEVNASRYVALALLALLLLELLYRYRARRLGAKLAQAA